MLCAAASRDRPKSGACRVALRLSSGGATTRHELTDAHPIALIGRAPQSDIRLDDPEISRRHALLVKWGSGLFCLDLGSRAGTHVGPEGASSGWLTADHPVRFGSCHLEWEDGASAESVKLMLHRDVLPSGAMPQTRLEFLSAGIEPATYVLRRALTLVGRKFPCKIQLRLPRIQSVHAALLLTAQGLYVRDLSGKEGLLVDGQRWQSGWLQHDQVLEPGDTRIRVCVSPAGTAGEPAVAESDVAPITCGMPNSEDTPGGTSLPSCVVTSSAVGDSESDVRAEDVPSTLRLPHEQGRAVRRTRQRLRGRRSPLGRRYHVLERLARGGMGVVYKGYDARLGRHVAIKVARGQRKGSDIGRQRLLREAMVCARLDHPHIVHVLDADPRGRFAVFEFIAGRTLCDELQQHGPLTPRTAARWMAQIAEAVDHAAGRGVVHRDIKPANVLISGPDQVKLIDFGLSFIADISDSRELTALCACTERRPPGVAIGTAPFTAPEQFTNSHAVDTRSDIYSIGCTLYALVAGRPPFFGTLKETFHKHREERVPLIAGAPLPLMQVIETCLAKEPSARYQTGAALAADLRAFLRRDVPTPPVLGLVRA